MSAIKIAKGYPISLLISVKQNDVVVNINDGTWTYSASLHYQTSKGTVPFALSVSPAGSQFLIELANTQTTQLSHLGTGYVLVIDASKNDQTVFIQDEIQVSVTDGL